MHGGDSSPRFLFMFADKTLIRFDANQPSVPQFARFYPCALTQTRGKTMNFFVHGVIRTGGDLHAHQIGEYWNFEEAIAAAKQHIDDFLYREYKRAVWHGISGEKLFLLYKRAGEAMLVVPKNSSDTFVLHFDHLDYAARKCAEICAKTTPPPQACPTKA